jgi:hypothetical protein
MNCVLRIFHLSQHCSFVRPGTSTRQCGPNPCHCVLYRLLQFDIFDFSPCTRRSSSRRRQLGSRNDAICYNTGMRSIRNQAREELRANPCHRCIFSPNSSACCLRSPLSTQLLSCQGRCWDDRFSSICHDTELLFVQAAVATSPQFSPPCVCCIHSLLSSSSVHLHASWDRRSRLA